MTDSDRKERVCPRCKGDGQLDYDRMGFVQCPRCNGSGNVSGGCDDPTCSYRAEYDGVTDYEDRLRYVERERDELREALRKIANNEWVLVPLGGGSPYKRPLKPHEIARAALEGK